MSSPGTENQGRVINYLRSLNATRAQRNQPPIDWVQFDSRIPTFDRLKSPGRFLVYFPVVSSSGQMERELYVQFGAPGAQSNQLSVVAVVPGENGNQTYFRDYRRTYENGRATVDSPINGESGNACINCHKSGLLSIVPANSNLDSQSGQALNRINERIRSSGMSEVPFTLSDSSVPVLGQRRERSDDFMRRCTEAWLILGRSNQNPVVNLERIRSAMDCARCHNGSYRGRLTIPLDPLTSSYILNGSMPPGNNLNSDERNMLNVCLKWDLYGEPVPNADPISEQPGNGGALLSYLTGEQCTNPASSRTQGRLQSPAPPTNPERSPRRHKR